MKTITKIIYTTVALVLPFASIGQQLDRSHLPTAGPAPIIKFKDPVIYHYPNGMTLLVVEDHRFPVVSANFYIDQGPVTEGSKAGVMSILGDMLAEGTTRMSKTDFDNATDILGANVGFNSAGGSAEALARFFPKAFALFSEALRSPALLEPSFEKLKSLNVTSLKSQEKNVKAISGRMVNALTYGKSHPYGEFSTIETIQSLTLEDVREAYHRYFTPHRAYLTIVGDITPAEADKLASISFKNWQGNVLKLPVLADVPNPTQSEIDVVDVPSAVQSEIAVVNLNDLRLTSPDYFATQVANIILGGGSDAHLFKSLREKRGFTYGAYSSIGAGRYQTLFNANAAVRTVKTDSAVIEFMAQIKQMREQPVQDDELRNAKALFNGTFALRTEDPSVQAVYARNILINNLPKDYYRTYLQRINAVTATDIRHAAQKYFSYEHSRIVIAGNASQFLDNLKKLPYPVKVYDRSGNMVTK